jgi:hypothetical protein
MSNPTFKATRYTGNVPYAFEYKVGERYQDSYTVVAVVWQEDSHNLGRMFFKKDRSPKLYQAWVRKGGQFSTVSGHYSTKVKELPEVLANLAQHGALINPDITLEVEIIPE